MCLNFFSQAVWKFFLTNTELLVKHDFYFNIAENCLYYDAIYDFSVWLRTGSNPADANLLMYNTILVYVNAASPTKSTESKQLPKLAIKPRVVASSFSNGNIKVKNFLVKVYRTVCTS